MSVVVPYAVFMLAASLVSWVVRVLCHEIQSLWHVGQSHSSYFCNFVHCIAVVGLAEQTSAIMWVFTSIVMMISTEGQRHTDAHREMLQLKTQAFKQLINEIYK